MPKNLCSYGDSLTVNAIYLPSESQDPIDEARMNHHVSVFERLLRKSWKDVNVYNFVACEMDDFY